MDWTVLHFFFDFRGGKGVTNNFEGLLKSLLHQLIEKIPQIIDDGENRSISNYSEHKLRIFLRTTLENAKKDVCIFVDGLDEYEGSIRDVIVYLRSLVKNSDSGDPSVKICVSSRPEPIPAHLLQDVPHLLISDHNRSGIQQYCQLTLDILESMTHEDLNIQQLSRDVAERADGVFLWAHFALDQIMRGHANGETFEDISERLNLIPDEVEGIYDRILSRMEPIAKKECMIMLQLVCFAEISLSWQELLVATDVAMGKELVIYERLCGNEDYSKFVKRLRGKAGGLLELVSDEREDAADRVKLIHKSVNTYLIQKGWQVLGEPSSIELVTHTLYVQICVRFLHRLIRYLKWGENSDGTVLKDCFNTNKLDRHVGQDYNYILPDSAAYPFLAYAAIHIFRHAKLLEEHGASSYALLHDGLTEQLFSLHILVGQYFVGDTYIIHCACEVPVQFPFEFINDDFDSCHLAFLHGLVSYCKDDLVARSSAPDQRFWERALTYAMWSSAFCDDPGEVTERLSLALQKVANVQQRHLETWLEGLFKRQRRRIHLEVGRLLLNHKSVKDLRLVDGNAQEVTIFLASHFRKGFYL